MKIKCRLFNLMDNRRWVEELDDSTTIGEIISRLVGGMCQKENPIYPLVSRLTPFNRLTLDGDLAARHEGVGENTTLRELAKRFGYRADDTMYFGFLHKMGVDAYSVNEDGVIHYRSCGDGTYVDYAGYQDSSGKWFLSTQYVDTYEGIKSPPAYFYDENEIRRELHLA